MKRQILVATGLCALTCLASPAVAQSVGTDAEAEAQPPSEGDIVVTARKREETAQRIPISIGVVTDAALTRTGSSSLLQLEAVAPGINLAKAPTGAEIGVTVRGLGSAPGSPSFDNSVSLFVDGVYAPRSREFASSMFDIGRIEVIKGTQAALLGKNTSLGAINVVTRKPGREFSLDLRGSYEFEYGSTLVTGGVDIPLGETLAVRLSGQTLNDKGWVRDGITGRRSPRNRDDAIRAVLVWEPTPDIDITLVGQHDYSVQRGSSVEFATLNPVAELLAGLAGAPGSLDNQLDNRNATYLTTPGSEQVERLKVDRFSATVNVGVGEGTITSVTAYSRYTDANLTDIDFLPGNWGTRGIDETSKQFSQELRYVSPSGRTVDYLVGGLYLHNELDSQGLFDARYPFGPPGLPNIDGAFQNEFVQKTDTFSAFAQLTVNATDQLRLTGGLRYTSEKKNVDLARLVVRPGLYSLGIFPPYAPFSDSRTDSPIDYSGGVQYDVTPDIMLYASYGKGTKSGGFASSATFLDQSEYSSETARTIEAGVKAQDAGRRWLFNLSLFSTRVDNFQVVTFNGQTFNIFNTDLKSTGFELEASWRPVDGLRLFINNTYADAKDRLTGTAIPLAPKWSGTGGFSFRQNLSDSLVFMADGSIDYRSSRTYQQDPAASVIGNAFTTYNLSVAFGDANDRWEARLIGRNLSDKRAVAFSFPTPIIGTQSVMSERPRTIALQLSFKF
ncbi:TonB-dependent receptor [Novosphingobium sp.]|uniref:TonB-dependent receptor n=1 Tax=Novosphingobium sp. TaxID=1874826 RepID=UPI002733027F|nr:TonB-dependent receptor [Novosphingobium sp.]MDP3907567.1 TonB-dependent receptor [Novosphingobium sp.]